MKEIEIKINNAPKLKIINIPSPEDYFSRSYEIFSECFYLLCSILIMNEEDSPDLIEEKIKKQSIEFITKLQQSTEIFLSGIIISESVVDLIKSEYLFDFDSIIDFDDLVTINTEKLLERAQKIKGNTFFSNCFEHITFKQIFESNRKIRNKNMHSLVRKFDIDIKMLVCKFISTWHIFFKKHTFIKDIYKIILKNFDILKLDGISLLNFGLIETERMKKIPALFIHHDRIINRKFLFRIINILNKTLTKNEFKNIISGNKSYADYICPHCEGLSRTEFESGRLDYDEYYDDELTPLKSLITIEKNKLSSCYVCGHKVTKEKVHIKFCKQCNKDTPFSSIRIKRFIYNNDKREYPHDFCLLCGCISEHPLQNENTAWY